MFYVIIFYDEMCAILKNVKYNKKDIMSFVNVNASPVFFQYFVLQDYCFMTVCSLSSFWRCSRILFHKFLADFQMPIHIATGCHIF